MKTTNRGIITLINDIAIYLSQHKDEDTKFVYALGRIDKRARKLHGKYQEKIEDVSIDNAMTEEKTGKILRNAHGGYEFTKDGLKKLSEETRAMLDAEVEIEPYLAPDLPEKMSPADKDKFIGFAIEGEQEE